MGTIWEYRYESGIPKNQKVLDLVYVYNTCTFESPDFYRYFKRYHKFAQILY